MKDKKERKERVAILLSGGKDSVYAFHKAKAKYNVDTAIIMLPKNPASWMWHAINARYAVVVARALGIKNVIRKITAGEKETELKDLEQVLKHAKEHGIKAIVAGAIASKYQKERLEQVAKKLRLKLYAPLWQKKWQEDQYAYMKSLLAYGIKFIIVAIACEGIDKHYLGKVIEEKDLQELYKASKKYGFNLSFEGGEAETLAIDGPLFKYSLKVSGEVIKQGAFEWIYKIKKIVKEKKRRQKGRKKEEKRKIYKSCRIS
jgi:ABC transporter with metal-binding/Fe-S-binding domain ATP-binding protein